MSRRVGIDFGYPVTVVIEDDPEGARETEDGTTGSPTLHRIAQAWHRVWTRYYMWRIGRAFKVRR